MDTSSGDISSIIFRQSVKSDLGRFSFDSQMLSVFMAIDGHKRLGKISKETGIDMSTMRLVISRLMRLNIIEQVQEAVPTLDDDFIIFLKTELSLAIGPLAGVLIEDAAEDLGFKLNKLPCHRAAELVDLLSQDIQRDEKQKNFKFNMVKKIKEKGY